MQLTVHERLKLIEIMPPKADYSGVKEIVRTTMLLMLTGEEAEELEVKHIEGMIQFNQDKALTMIVDVPMGEWMTNIFREILREKSHDDELEPAEISLYEKFIMDYE